MALIFGTNNLETLDCTAAADRISGRDSTNGFGDEGPAHDNDRIAGGAGSDTVLGGAGRDTLLGGRGHDVLFGAVGQDVLRGGGGVDLIYGSKADHLFGGAGIDAPYATLGRATGSVDLALADTSGWLAAGFKAVAGFEVYHFTAGNGDDRITGGALGDTLAGWDGNDILHGGAGSDGVFCGYGHDLIFGEEWVDRLFGGAGNDTIYGDFGDATYGIGKSHPDLGVRGGPHSYGDTIYGGAGDDFIAGDAGSNVLDCCHQGRQGAG